MGFYLGTLLSNRDINLAPQYLELDTTVKFNFKKLYDSLSPLVSKGKRMLLKFIYNPASMSNYAIKEVLIRKVTQPLIDVFSIPHGQVKDAIFSLACHMLLVNENSMYFSIMERYERLLDYQIPGISKEIGGVYHYDCLI